MATKAASAGISVNYVWTNDSGRLNMQGATNNALYDADGKCVDPVINQLELKPGEPWPAEAAAIIANAGRRTGKQVVRPTIPPLSPTSAQHASDPFPRRSGSRMAGCPLGPRGRRFRLLGECKDFGTLEGVFSKFWDTLDSF